MSPHHVIESETLGQCWMAISSLILTSGVPTAYDSAPILEVANATLITRSPDPQDAFIQQHGDPAWLDWMHQNFFVQKEVVELGRADSYAVRLFNYARQGRDQVQWVIDRLQANPQSRSATITTFQTLTDTSYIPCISLLDFWVPDGSVELVVYAHSLDFGKKAYGNLVELAILQSMVANALTLPAGRLIIHVKSAHIYEPEYSYMRGLVGEVGG
jgi:thymidylate synthase